jgi:hypothetical protein
MKRKAEAQTLKEIALLDRLILYRQAVHDTLEWLESSADYPPEEFEALVTRLRELR